MVEEKTQAIEQLKVTKPDIDNLMKTVLTLVTIICGKMTIKLQK